MLRWFSARLRSSSSSVEPSLMKRARLLPAALLALSPLLLTACGSHGSSSPAGGSGQQACRAPSGRPTGSGRPGGLPSGAPSGMPSGAPSGAPGGVPGGGEDGPGGGRGGGCGGPGGQQEGRAGGQARQG